MTKKKIAHTRKTAKKAPAAAEESGIHAVPAPQAAPSRPHNVSLSLDAAEFYTVLSDIRRRLAQLMIACRDLGEDYAFFVERARAGKLEGWLLSGDREKFIEEHKETAHEAIAAAFDLLKSLDCYAEVTS